MRKLAILTFQTLDGVGYREMAANLDEPDAQFALPPRVAMVLNSTM